MVYKKEKAFLFSPSLLSILAHWPGHFLSLLPSSFLSAFFSILYFLKKILQNNTPNMNFTKMGTWRVLISRQAP